MELKHVSGIYYIKNKNNNKYYIGQSLDVKLRIKQHFNYGSYESYIDKVIKEDPSIFIYDVIEYCPIDQLNELEQYYISYFDSYENGYNLTLGGEGFLANKSVSKPVIQYSYDYKKELKRYPSATIAASNLNVTCSGILDVCKGKSYNGHSCQHCNNYGFLYVDAPKEELLKRQEKFSNSLIIVYPLNNLEIPILNDKKVFWRQTDIVNELGLNASSICSVLNHTRRLVKNASGQKYTLMYEDSNDLEEWLKEEIVELTYNNTVSYFLTKNELSKATGICRNTINNIIDGRSVKKDYQIRYCLKQEYLEKHDV